MVLTDKDIKQFIINGDIKENTVQTAIFNGDPDNITNIGYDLTIDAFYSDNKTFTEYSLRPNESVFVSSKEVVHFDNFTMGRINIKNSRLRMGLSVESPVYQPGHTTKIYFRVSNVSGKTVSLEQGEKCATLFFEQLTAEPERPYNGTFQKEFDFRGLAGYKSQYDKQIKQIEKKKDDIKALEKAIYSNVVTILSIFIAIYSLINVNIELVGKTAGVDLILTFNLSIIGAISLFALFIHSLIFKEKKSRALWLVPIICLLGVMVLMFV